MERLEDAAQQVGCHAASGVGHRHDHLDVVFSCVHLAPLHMHPHRPACGELDGVVDEVVEHLRQPPGIADQRARRIAHEQLEAQPLGLGRTLRRAHGRADGVGQLERRRRQWEARVPEVRQVQDVVGELTQLGGAGPDIAHPGGLLVAQAAARQQVDHARDAVERGADLVADRGHEAQLHVGLPPGALHLGVELLLGVGHSLHRRAQLLVAVHVAGDVGVGVHRVARGHAPRVHLDVSSVGGVQGAADRSFGVISAGLKPR